LNKTFNLLYTFTEIRTNNIKLMCTFKLSMLVLGVLKKLKFSLVNKLKVFERNDLNMSLLVRRHFFK